MVHIALGVLVKMIRNYVQLLPNIATSGQPTVEQFKEIASGGYEVVINLAMPSHQDAIADEGNIVAELGMRYLHLPVPFDRPTAEHLRQFLKIMAALKGSKIWVHCIMNYRVAVFMFHYLSKIENYSDAEATSPIFSEWTPNSEWQALLALSSSEIGL